MVRLRQERPACGEVYSQGAVFRRGPDLFRHRADDHPTVDVYRGPASENPASAAVEPGNSARTDDQLDRGSCLRRLGFDSLAAFDRSKPAVPGDAGRYGVATGDLPAAKI